MKTNQYLIVALLTICALLSGCTRKVNSAERPPTPVKAETVQAYSASGGARYSASIVPGSQVDLAFSVGGYLEKILQVKRRRRPLAQRAAGRFGRARAGSGEHPHEGLYGQG